MLRLLVRLIVFPVFAVLIGIGGMVLFDILSSPKIQSAFTHDEVGYINPLMIIDRYTLMSEGNFQISVNYTVEALIKRGFLIPTPFGLVTNPDLKGKIIPVIIQSGGGQVALGMQLVEMIKSLKQVGAKVECHVGEAQSMAFFIMVTVCDKVVAKKDATLMQHRVSYGGSTTTPATYLMDVELSKAEAEALGVDSSEWQNLVRGPQDHVFTPEEIQKYKLVDEWVD
jgi:ATP-dependent protease ClpP protease subunit